MPAGLIKIKKYKGVYYRLTQKEGNRDRNGKPDRCFYVTYRGNTGKFVREKIGWSSEGYTAALADQVRAERIRSLRHGKELPDKKHADPTFGEAWKKYDAWLDTGKKHVYDDRNRYKNHVEPRYRNKALSDITTHDLEKFKDTLLKKGLSPATTKHVLVLIRQVYNKAVLWGLWSGTPPTKGLKMPRIDNKRVRFLTHPEAATLLQEIRKRSKTQYEIGLISLHTGMRANEVFSALWGHIDLGRGVIHVADPKGGTAREAYMTEAVKEMLAGKQRGEPHQYVYQNREGTKFGEVSKTWLRAIRALGFNDGITDRRQLVTFHTLRHTYASWLAIQGTPILEIKELLGHKTLAMTERYAHLIPDKKRETVKKFEAAIIDANHEEAT